LERAKDHFEENVTLKRLFPLDILEAHPSAALPLSGFLSMLPAMRIRQLQHFFLAALRSYIGNIDLERP